MKRLLSIVALSLFLLTLPLSSHGETKLRQGARNGFAVIELFTSQGCSSCPPADALLTSFKQQANTSELKLFPLSFHVDYWNYLGWKDPYSGTGATERQHDYAKIFGSDRVYTPQMIVNGSAEFVGSDTRKAYRAINNALKTPTHAVLRLKVTQGSSAKSVFVSYTVSHAPKNTLLRFAAVDSPAPNQVSRGENRGQTLSHTNVVRNFRTIQLSKNTGRIELDISSLEQGERSIVAFLQTKDTMRIIAVDKQPL